MIGYYNIANLITFISVAFAVATMHFAIEGDFVLATVCLIAAGIADMFDGLVARKLKLSEAQKDFGKNLDALADVVAFAVAPAIYWYALFGNGIVELSILTIYVIAAVVRLAWFNVHGLDEVDKKSYYKGLPVTFAAFIFPLVFTAVKYFAAADLSDVLIYVPLLVAVLFIAPVPVPKPKGISYLIFPLLAIAVIVVNLMLWK
jgi:CDP-diacylglycerol--serine O-phosphatidyltransferase